MRRPDKVNSDMYMQEVCTCICVYSMPQHPVLNAAQIQKSQKLSYINPLQSTFTVLPV